MSSGLPASDGPSLAVVDGLASAAGELRAHGYAWPAVKDRTGMDWRLPFPLERLDEVDTPALPDAERPPVDWLIRLLLLGDTIAAERLEGFLAADTRDALERAGLLLTRDGTVSSAVLLLPFEDLLLACDWPWVETTSRVIVPDPSSAFTVEHVAPLPGEPRATAIDIGTGCGILAFVAARHYERVTGVDTSPRAIEFARFNAALNAVDVAFYTCTPSFLADELDEPVDLVTFVLPVLLPHLWRRAAAAHVSHVEAGVEGKPLALAVYRHLAAALRPGGRALLFHQVPLEPGDDLAAWLAESGALGALSVVMNPVSVRPRFAFTRVAAYRDGAGDTPGAMRTVPGPETWGRPQSREDLLRHLATEDLLARRDGEVGAARPRLYDWVHATTVAPVTGGVLEAAGRLLDGRPAVDDAWAFVHAVDGRSTVVETGERAGLPDPESVARGLAAAGLISLQDGLEPA